MPDTLVVPPSDAAVPSAPEVPIVAAVIPGAPREMHAVFRAADGTLSRPLTNESIEAALATTGGTLWVDVDSRSATQRQTLADVFHVHPLHVEDVENQQSRVKVEEIDGKYIIAVVRVVQFCATTEDPYDVETSNLSVLIGPNWVVTAHASPAPSVAQVSEIVRRNPDLLARGPARIGHMVLDAAMDAYFPLLDDIGGFVDDLEERVFVKCEPDALRPIFAVKRLVLSLRRYLSPQREVFGILSNRPSKLLPPELQVYFRDVYDHVLRINDDLDNYRELLAGVLDGFLSQVNNRLGQVTKGLSVVATLSLPFVVVSGMWGMNVNDIPLAKHPHGFLIMFISQLILGGGLVALLRKRGLL